MFKKCLGLNYLGPKFIYPFSEKYVKRDILSKLDYLKSFRHLSPKEREEQQREKLISTLEYCSTHVPYYRNLFKEHNISIEKIKSDFRHYYDIPYLTKDIIKDSHLDLISDEYRDQFLCDRKTGGSTGRSVIIKYSLDSLDWTAACNLLTYDMIDRKMSDLEVHLSSDFNDVPTNTKDKLYGLFKSISMNRECIFTRDFDEASMKSLYKKLKSLNPYLIQGHPSTMYALAMYVKHNVKKRVTICKKFISTGETLDDKKAISIAEYLGCTVLNRFGNAEFGVVANSTTHFNELEIIDSMCFIENYLISSTEPELVITGLENPAMPLIRYRTGDLGEVFSKNNIPHLRNIKGRVHDIIRINDELIPSHFIQDLIDKTEGVEEFQLITDSDHNLKRILIAGIDSINKQELYNNIKNYFGTEINLEFVNFEDFKKIGWRDKFRYVYIEE